MFGLIKEIREITAPLCKLDMLKIVTSWFNDKPQTTKQCYCKWQISALGFKMHIHTAAHATKYMQTSMVQVHNQGTYQKVNMQINTFLQSCIPEYVYICPCWLHYSSVALSIILTKVYYLFVVALMILSGIVLFSVWEALLLLCPIDKQADKYLKLIHILFFVHDIIILYNLD